MAQLFTNNAVSLLAAPISPIATTLTVMSGLGILFPQPAAPGDYFLVTLENQTGTLREIIRVEGRTGDTFTNILRGQEGTVPATWTAVLGDDTLVDHRVTAETMRLAMQLPIGGGSAQQLYAENPNTPTIPVALGSNSISIGSGAQALADNSLAIGDQSLTRHQGAMVRANGRFASTGDVQEGNYLLRNITSSNIPVELFLDGVGGARRLVLPDDSTWTFKVMVTAHRTDASDGHAGYTFTGVIYRIAGVNTVAFQGRPVKSVLAESNTPLDVNITANPSFGSLSITVVGQNSKTFRWAASVQTLEITN